MDDIPQGGAGGVPLHHDDEEPPQDHRPDGDQREEAPAVKTVRGGTPVAEQRTGTGQGEDTDGSTDAQPDDRD